MLDDRSSLRRQIGRQIFQKLYSILLPDVQVAEQSGDNAQIVQQCVQSLVLVFCEMVE